MGKTGSAVLGAIIYLNPTFASVSADTVAFALPAPLPTYETVLPELPNLHPSRFAFDPTALASPPQTDFPAAVRKQADISAFGFACETTLTVTPSFNAMLDVTIQAPCKPDQSVSVQYSGVVFDATLSMTGDAVLQVPALQYQDELGVAFEDNQTLYAATLTPELSGFVRVAVGWDHPKPPTLSGTAPRHLPIDVLTLGDGSGRSVQVLSHHVDPEAKAGVIRLGMLATVTAENCGDAQSAQVVRQSPDVPQLRYVLTLAAAGCDQVGHNLELKNILQDLKLASN